MPPRKPLGCLACRELHLRCENNEQNTSNCSLPANAFKAINSSQSVRRTSRSTSDHTGDANGEQFDIDHDTALAATNNYTCNKEKALLSRDRYRAELDNEIFDHELAVCSSGRFDPSVFEHTSRDFQEFLSGRLLTNGSSDNDLLLAETTWQPQIGPAESHILDYYIRVASSWLDGASPARYFSETVSLMALNRPLLYFVCLSYASHVMFLRGQFQDETLHDYYYDTAIRLLIHELSKENDGSYYEILGSTTAILRMREQFSEIEHDGEFHLHGASSVFAQSGWKWSVNSKEPSSAAFWLFVRQTIRAGFLHEEKYTCVLAQIEDDWEANGTEHDVAWTNRITYLLARLCNICWGRPNSNRRDSDLLRIESLLDRWKQQVPNTMQPWCNTKSPDDVFELIRYVTSWHTIAWEFYHAARVVLAVYSPAQPVNGSLLKLNQYINNNVIEPTRQLCSVCIADNNEGSQLNGVHLVGWCARFLTAHDEQQAVLDYMSKFMEEMKWPNQTDIDRLKSAWSAGLP